MDGLMVTCLRARMCQWRGAMVTCLRARMRLDSLPLCLRHWNQILHGSMESLPRHMKMFAVVSPNSLRHWNRRMKMFAMVNQTVHRSLHMVSTHMIYHTTSEKR